MWDGLEESVDVTLEHVAGLVAIAAYMTKPRMKRLHCSMRSFAFAARIGVCEERRLEKRVERGEDGMMNDTVAHGCFVDEALLRIANREGIVRAVFVAP